MSKFYLAVFSLCCNYLFSQNYSITGSIINIKKETIEFGNIIALSTKDSSLIKGEIFVDGKFRINNIFDSTLILKITSLGYVDFYEEISNIKGDTLIDVGLLELLSNSTLKEIEIVSKAPLFERDAEKVKVNVENSMLSTLGTLLDVLKRSPTVRVDNSDNVSVFGKGNAIIYVDGQLIASSDFLKTIPSSEIKEIEIINNPSAKYDAAGKAVINIITKKNNLEGYNGNLVQNALYGKNLFTYTGFRFNYKKNKIATFIGYGFPHGKSWSKEKYYRNIINKDSSITEMNNQLNTITNNINSHYYRAGLNYFIDSLNMLGIQYGGYYSKSNNPTDNINDVLNNNTLQLSMHTITEAKPQSINNSLNANYTRKLDTLQSEFSVALQYANFISNNLNEIRQDITNGSYINSQQKRSTGNNNIQIYTTQSDLVKVFNKKWKLEGGLKNSNISNNSKINFENYIGNQWLSDSIYLNGYHYSENIFALYSQLRYSKNKFNARAGFRAEHTLSDGTSKISGQKIIKRNYINYFPSAFAGYDFTKDLNAGITYSTRISRPTFQDLDPFINYIDSLSSFRGNPYLKPSYTHSLEASLIYMKEASLTFSYSRTNGAMNLVVNKLNDSTNAFAAITENLNYSEIYSIGITIPYELKWWTTYNYLGYMQNVFNYKSKGTVINNIKPMFYMYLYNEFRAKKLFSSEITFEYTSAGVDGIFTFQPFYNLSANIKKTFFKDKLTCRLIASDIFSTSYQRGNSNVSGFTVNYESRERIHYFLLSLNYRFGKLKANNYKDKTVNQEEVDRIKAGK